MLAISFLSGCATSYQPNGFGGGYSEMALSNDEYRVIFRGNGFTSSDLVQSYVLRRSAELTLNKGYKYFLILDSGTDVNREVVQTPTTVHTNTYGTMQGAGYGTSSYYGNTAYGNYNYTGYGSANSYTTIQPGTEYEVDRYQSGVVIKMLHSKKAYPQAFDAEIILSNFQG